MARFITSFTQKLKIISGNRPRLSKGLRLSLSDNFINIKHLVPLCVRQPGFAKEGTFNEMAQANCNWCARHCFYPFYRMKILFQKHSHQQADGQPKSWQQRSISQTAYIQRQSSRFTMASLSPSGALRKNASAAIRCVKAW